MGLVQFYSVVMNSCPQLIRGRLMRGKEGPTYILYIMCLTSRLAGGRHTGPEICTSLMGENWVHVAVFYPHKSLKSHYADLVKIIRRLGNAPRHVC